MAETTKTPVAEWMNTAEAAEYIGCSERTLRESRGKTRRGRPGPQWHDNLGGIQYKKTELDEYLETTRRSPRRPVPGRGTT